MRNTLRPLLLLVLLTACGSATDSKVPTAARLDVVSGNEQEAIFGRPVPAPLVVRAVDSGGNPVRGAAVLWTAAHGSLSTASSVTDASGMASTTWTLGPSGSVQIVTAAVNGAPPIVFTARGRPEFPMVINSCETHHATLCAAWQLQGEQYMADWPNGSHGVIDITRFDSDSVVFTRNDPSGVSPGIHAVYRGAPVRNAVVGTVTWTDKGVTFSGEWEARW